ncbi:MAG TPA: type VI secretion system tube protein Hcp [Planctomycetota bacterium]|nr:type VI secretion system tube protein Hcp [Planctomycetota bacterium]
MGYATYLKIDGLAGECAEEAHRGWLLVDSFSHTVSHPAQSGGVSLGDFSIAKYVDRSTPLVARATAEGRLFKEVSLELCRTDDRQAKFMEIRLSKVRVTMHSLSGGPQADVRTPYESINLSYENIEWFYFPAAFEPTPEAAVEVRTGWSAPSALATT